MKIFFLFLFLGLPLCAELLNEKQLSERLEAAKAKEDNATTATAWEEALNYLRAANNEKSAEENFQSKLTTLEKLPELNLPKPTTGSESLPELEAELKNLASLIKTSQTSLKDLADQPDQSAKRSATLAEDSARARSELEELQIPPLGDSELEAALHHRAQAKKQQLEAKLATIAAEQALILQETKVMPDRLKQRREHLEQLKKIEAKLFEDIAELREEKSEEIRESLDEVTKNIGEIEVITNLVEEVRELNAQRFGEDGLEAKIRDAREYAKDTKNLLRSIGDRFEGAKRRIELLESADLGIDDETGLQLRDQRAELPGTDEISDKLRTNLEAAADAQISLLDLSDRINSPPPLSEGAIEELLEENSDLKREMIDTILSRRIELLSSLSSDYRQLNNILFTGTRDAKLTITEINEYSEFIDERLLWIKSTAPISLKEPFEEWNRLVALFHYSNFSKASNSIARNWFSLLVPLAVPLTIVAIAFFQRRKLRAVLDLSSKQAVRRNCTSILPTLKYLGASVLLSLPPAAICYALYLLIDDPTAWKAGFLRLAIFLFFSALIFRFTRPHGLFDCHFRIPSSRSKQISQNIKLLVPIAAPLVFIIPALTSAEHDTASGRGLFILAMMVTSVFAHRLFRPRRSILGPLGETTSIARVCYFLTTLTPLVFAIGAALGYFESVLILRNQFMQTLGLLIFAFIIISLFTRWILISRRRLAIAQAMRRREAAVAERERQRELKEREEETTAPEEIFPDIPSLEEVKANAVNVVEVEEKTIQLLRTISYAAVFFGIWAIWSPTLPALSALDRVTLWGDHPTESQDQKKIKAPLFGFSSSTGKADQSSTATENSKDAKANSTSDDRVSLEDLLLAVVFFLITFIAARNIPSLLSLTLFDRFNLGPGGNFAMTTTARYLIILVGVVIALGQIGITWGKVQWLAAAITLGIGFGLQEIFANFVAGMILLFERPIRLGDVVTVGEVSGRVTQINIRATTIQQFNNRELLVPNKAFITSELINWTLKDSVLRFEVNVGIAYGSDTKEATRILQEILEDHPKILQDPHPNVLFTAFGASSLDFQARAFVSTVENLISVQSEIHYQINDAFADAGIEIAFPQQDVHLRSMPEAISLKKATEKS